MVGSVGSRLFLGHRGISGDIPRVVLQIPVSYPILVQYAMIHHDKTSPLWRLTWLALFGGSWTSRLHKFFPSFWIRGSSLIGMFCSPICLCLPVTPVLLRRCLLFLFVVCVPSTTFPPSSRMFGRLGFHLLSVAVYCGLLGFMRIVWWWVFPSWS